MFITISSLFISNHWFVWLSVPITGFWLGTSLLLVLLFIGNKSIITGIIWYGYVNSLNAFSTHIVIYAFISGICTHIIIESKLCKKIFFFDMYTVTLHTVQTYSFHSHCPSAEQEWDLYYSMHNHQCYATTKSTLSFASFAVSSIIFLWLYSLLLAFQCQKHMQNLCIIPLQGTLILWVSLSLAWLPCSLAMASLALIFQAYLQVSPH